MIDHGRQGQHSPRKPLRNVSRRRLFAVRRSIERANRNPVAAPTNLKVLDAVNTDPPILRGNETTPRILEDDKRRPPRRALGHEGLDLRGEVFTGYQHRTVRSVYNDEPIHTFRDNTSAFLRDKNRPPRRTKVDLANFYILLSVARHNPAQCVPATNVGPGKTHGDGVSLDTPILRKRERHH